MSDPLMNVRAFLRGGYRDLTEPTTIISGSTRLGVWLPESWRAHQPYDGFDAAPGPVHPEPEGATHGASTGGAEPETAGGRTEAPSHGGAAPSAGRGGDRRAPVKAPARRSIQATLDAANKAGRE